MATLPPENELRKIYPDTFYSGGGYMRQPKGTVRYYLIGPPDGTKVALIHGISTPCIIFKHAAEKLASRGFHVLLYDLFGRGYTDAPKDVEYNADLYITQLALLLQYVGWQKTHIVGLSMGGGIAATFAATFPQLLLGLVVFVAAAGMREEIPSTESGQRNKPNEAPLPSVMNQAYNLQAANLSGYKEAFDSSRAKGPIRGLRPTYEEVAKLQHIRVMIVHGTADNIVPYSHGKLISQVIPHGILATFDGAGHDLLMAPEYREAVSMRIAEFLEEQGRKQGLL